MGSLGGSNQSSMNDENPRSVQPHLIRDPTALETLASHWRTWTQHDDTKQRSEITTSTATTSTNHGAGPGATARVEESTQTSFPISPPQLSSSERIIWSGWDEILEDSPSLSARRILIVAYASLGITIWDCSALDAWSELISVSSIFNCFGASDDESNTFNLNSHTSTIAGACILPPNLKKNKSKNESATAEPPLLAILLRPPSNLPPASLSSSSSRPSPAVPQSHIVIYSLQTHKIVQSWAVAGMGHRISANARQIVVATSSPLALHLYSTTADFAPFSYSPIRDLAPSPVDGSPTFVLGRGGRLLAYATSTKVVSGTSSAARYDEREFARPGTGILAQRGFFDTEDVLSPRQSGSHSSYDRASFFEDARAAGVVGGEVARRVGGGVLSGAKALGQLGYHYWNASSGLGTATHTESSDDVQSFSSTSMGSTSTIPLPLSPPLSGISSSFPQPQQSYRSTSSRTARASPDLISSTAGTVIVVNLPQESRTHHVDSVPTRKGHPTHVSAVAHFRACSSPIVSLSFTPSSASILVAPSEAHHFDVFELKPNRSRKCPSPQYHASFDDPEDNRPAKVWHRYRLNRGLTSARTTSVTWSDDGRLVAIGTGKGTTHVYALNPSGGKADLSSHFGPHVVNEKDLAPLSTSLSTIARIRRGLTSDQMRTLNLDSSFLGLSPKCVFVPKAVSTMSRLRPESVASSSSLRSSPIGATTSFASASTSHSSQDILLFCPATATCLLERLRASPAPSTTTEAASRGDVGRLASTAVSGLTQLMKSRGGGQSRMSTTQDHLGAHASGTKQWVVILTGIAEWCLVKDDTREDFAMTKTTTAFQPRGKRNAKQHYSAQAEIETFSRSPRILPRSLYTSQQFQFFDLPRDYALQQSLGHLPKPLQRLEIRSQVQVREGGGSKHVSVDRDDDVFSNRAEELLTFDQPIQSAMQTILDDPATLSTQASSSPIDPFAHPGFPNGVAGKQGRHAHSGLAIPIRVGATIGQGLVSTVRGVVAITVPAGQNLRRRASGSTSAASAGYYSSSVSFEDDAVFANRDDESTSTTCTSELDEEERGEDVTGCGTTSRIDRDADGQEEEEEATWGWTDDDLFVDETSTTTLQSKVQRPESILEIPFEEDIDDFMPSVANPVIQIRGKTPVPVMNSKESLNGKSVVKVTTVAAGRDESP